MFKYMSTEVNNYKQYKEKLDTALTSAADNMVRVGYLLMQARDTDILKESGYSGMGDFAKSEYGLSPDQTSRFISIAERFGDGEGRLQDQWQQFGYSKLSEMLSLPDHVNEALSPEITREEIRELKAEVKAEEEITPIEAAIEQAEVQEKTPEEENTPMIRRFFREYFRENPHDFLRAIRIDWCLTWGEEDNRKAVLDALAPSGIAILVARIPGAGRFMLSFKGESNLPVFVATRENASSEMYWKDVREGYSSLTEGYEDPEVPADTDGEIRGIWSKIYGQQFPEEEKPVAQPEEKPAKKSEKKSEKKVKIAPAQIKKEEKKAEKEEKTQNQAADENVEQAAAPTACQPGKPAEVRDGMNPPESQGGTVKIVPEETKEESLPKGVREIKIEQAVKRVNRLALDLRDYAEKLEKVERNHNYVYISDLTFNCNEAWNKMNGELEELTRLLKMRWEEDEINDEEDGEDE